MSSECQVVQRIKMRNLNKKMDLEETYNNRKSKKLKTKRKNPKYMNLEK